MNATMLLLGGSGLSALVLSGAALLLLRQARHEEALAARVVVARGFGVAGAARRPGITPLRLVAGLGLAIVRSGLLSGRTLAELEQALVTSGFRAESALGLFVGSKILLLIVSSALAYLVVPADMATLTRDSVIGVAALAGLLAPDKIIQRIRTAYRRKLARGLADALDMLVICTQAGLGLEPAIARVAVEIRYAHPEIAHELALTASEMQVMADSRVALQRLGERTGLESLRRLAGTLAQSVQYGTPLSDAMRGLAAEMRQEILIAFEERAARLSVFLTIPMILFILPCVMIVVGGPAIIQLIKALSQ
jgi:tight adherence protein C